MWTFTSYVHRMLTRNMYGLIAEYNAVNKSLKNEVLENYGKFCKSVISRLWQSGRLHMKTEHRVLTKTLYMMITTVLHDNKTLILLVYIECTWLKKVSRDTKGMFSKSWNDVLFVSSDKKNKVKGILIPEFVMRYRVIINSLEFKLTNQFFKYFFLNKTHQQLSWRLFPQDVRMLRKFLNNT